MRAIPTPTGDVTRAYLIDLNSDEWPAAMVGWAQRTLTDGYERYGSTQMRTMRRRARRLWRQGIMV
jgi:hypothetical protein